MNYEAKKNKRVIVNLDGETLRLKSLLDKQLGHGWFSKFVRDQLKSAYGEKFKETLAISHLNHLQNQRDKLEREIEEAGENLGRLRRANQ